MKLTTKSGYTVETMARNVVEVIQSASESERDAGMQWYPKARLISSILAAFLPERDTEDGIETVAGILAALSPRTAWAANVERADSILRQGTCSGMSRSRDHALAILHGAAPLDILRGPKTRAFAVAIASGGAHGIAVIDTWAMRAATRGKYDDVARARYADVAQAYELAARRLRMGVHQAQAIAWVVTRGGAA